MTMILRVDNAGRAAIPFKLRQCTLSVLCSQYVLFGGWGTGPFPSPAGPFWNEGPLLTRWKPA